MNKPKPRIVRTVYGRTNGIPPHPWPGGGRYVRVVQVHVRMPRLYVALCWSRLHRVARRLCIWHSVGYIHEDSARFRGLALDAVLRGGVLALPESWYSGLINPAPPATHS